MKEREYYKRMIVFGLASLVVLALAALFGIVWYRYYREWIYRPFWNKGNWVLIALYALLVVLFSRLFGGIRVGYYKRMDMIYTLILSILCANLVAYLQITLIHRWFLPVWPLVLMTLADFAVAVVWTFLSQAIYARLYGARKMLVIYGDRAADDLIQKMQSRRDKYQICEKVHIAEGDQVIFRKMKEYEAVIIWDLPSQIRNRYLKYCFAHSIRCYITPKISDIIIAGSDRIHLFDTPLLLSRNMGLSAEQRVIKRAMDLVISAAAIVVFSPLMLLIALVVKAYDRGPVFYRQERLNGVGREFRIFKFRSMRVDSEKNGARLASKHDSRITPVGHVLRNLHLDELPQLFNVFLGDMSLVGPRPERKEIMRQYQKEIPEFDYRLKVKAGLTGYAQVYGKYNTTPYDKLKLDLFYIENYSLMLDIKLLFMTAKIFFQKETSEGIEDDQRTALRSEEHEQK